MPQLRSALREVNRFLTQPLVFFAVCLAMSLALTLPRAFSPFVSPYDEGYHLSYLQYVFNWVIPADGYSMNTWAKAAYSCHPVGSLGAVTPMPCGTLGEGKFYPEGGTNTASIWPPVYYVLVAALMRIPLLLVDNPLLAARLATGFLWALGVALIAIQLSPRKYGSFLALGVTMLLVSLPTFYAYTSFVSPHALNTLLVALALFVSNKIEASLRASALAHRDKSRLEWLGGALKEPWNFALIGLAVVCGFSIPQSLTLVAITALFTLLRIFNVEGVPLRARWSTTLVVGLSGALAAATFYLTYMIWGWQQHARAITAEAGTNQAAASIGPPDATYSSLVDRITQRWWSFWPNALSPQYPSTKWTDQSINLWVFILLGLSITAIVIWNRRSWIGPLMLALLVCAPIFSVAYDWFFPTIVPARYGMIFPILGTLGLTNPLFHRWARVALGCLCLATYLFAIFFERTYNAGLHCGLDAATRLITCR
jgi:hypothetical protein